jgi:histidinol phosphatase-like enzyme (inositol monophosphatase family)
MDTLATELDTACRIARRAGETALRYFRRNVAVEVKPDASPVTAADRECERLIAAALEEAFPADGIMGEEGAAKESRSGRRWWIDPIDGTRDFIRGTTAWAVMLALEAAGDVAAGVVHFPASGETFFASAGGGAYVNGDRIRVSGVGSAAQAVLCVNGLNNLGRYPFAPRLLDWMAPFWAVRSMGGCVDAMMLARGQADLWLDANGKPWDFAPLKVIAEEAGARFFDFSGNRTIHGGNCILTVPGLESEARRLLSMG